MPKRIVAADSDSDSSDDCHWVQKPDVEYYGAIPSDVTLETLRPILASGLSNLYDDCAEHDIECDDNFLFAELGDWCDRDGAGDDKFDHLLTMSTDEEKEAVEEFMKSVVECYRNTIKVSDLTKSTTQLSVEEKKEEASV